MSEGVLTLWHPSLHSPACDTPAAVPVGGSSGSGPEEDRRNNIVHSELTTL